MSEARPAEREQPVDSASRDDRGQMMLQLSKAVVGVHKHYLGRGPTKARSHLDRDLVTVVLEGGFTRSELTLLESGRDDEVARARTAMQDAVADKLRAAVEEIIRRPVRSVMSASDPAAGVQVEIFVLEPVPGADGNHPRRAQAQRHDGHRSAEHPSRDGHRSAQHPSRDGHRSAEHPSRDGGGPAEHARRDGAG